MNNTELIKIQRIKNFLDLEFSARVNAICAEHDIDLAGNIGLRINVGLELAAAARLSLGVLCGEEQGVVEDEFSNTALDCIQCHYSDMNRAND